MPEANPPRPITKWTIASWFIPLAVALGVLALTFAMNWEPWFGYASVIAGALLTLMLIGNHFKVGPGA